MTRQMTAVEFTERTGYAPVQDDLERVNCAEAGEPGHWGCGWCDKHNGPRYECGGHEAACEKVKAKVASRPAQVEA